MSPGGEHSKSLYNPVITSILTNTIYDGETKAQLMREVCLEALDSVAFVEIVMSSHDVVQISSQLTWTYESAMADMGNLS